jgi:acetyl-CoA C-acetyltransferase
MAEALIIDAVRTPRGKGKKDTGALSGLHPQELLSQCLNALKDRNGFDPKDVEDVIAGCVSAFGEQGACIARNAVLNAGWPVDSASGVTLNRFCGSGQQAVNFAAMGVLSGQQELVIGGGVEAMSRVPMGTDKSGLTGQNPHLEELHPMVPQGISADLIATIEGFSREDLDAFAAESQRRCEVAQKEGRFDNSLIPVKDLDGSTLLERDEHPRPGGTVESLGKLGAAFEGMGGFTLPGDTRTMDERVLERYPEAKNVQHVHHAGNSSGVVDGAAALLIASAEYAKAHGMKPRARVVATANMGDDPTLMLNAPVPSARKVLQRAGMTLADIDLFEVNEAFAVVSEKFQRDLDLARDKVNVNGGAMALGHPIGATGAILIGTVLDELERRDKQVGLITMCAGGGMAPAIIIERV